MSYPGRRSRLMGTWISLLTVLFASGCGTVSVKYIVEPQHDEAGLMKFRLAGSSITLAVKEPPPKADQPAKPDQPGQPPKTGYKLQALEPVLPTFPEGRTLKDLKSAEIAQFFGKPAYFKNVEALVTATGGSEVLALVVHDPFWQKTALSYSYQDLELLLLKTVGTEVTDNSKAIIDAAASVVTLLVVFGALGIEKPPEFLTLPVTIDVPAPVINTEWKTLPRHEKWWYRIERRTDRGEQKIARQYGGGQAGYDSGPGDTMDTVEFFSRYSNDRFWSTNTFPVAACQRVALHVRYSEDKPSEKELGTVQFLRSVAEPSRVRTIAIPSKGVISLGPICGGWVESKPFADPGWPALEETAKQIKAIKDALDKKEADEWKAKHPGQKPPPGKGGGN